MKSAAKATVLQAVVALLDGRLSAREAVQALMGRDPKLEV